MARSPLMQSSGGWDREAVPVVLLQAEGCAVGHILAALAGISAELSALNTRIDALTTEAGALRVDAGPVEGGLL